MSITLGNTTISGLAVGGLPSGTVNSSSLAAGAITPSKIGFSGCFLQTTISTYQSPWASGVSGNSWYNLPLSGSITPQFSSSRILVMTNLALWHNNSATIRILRNGSSVYQGANNNSNTAGTYHHALPFFPDGNHVDGRSYAFIDSPGTTSSISYTMQALSLIHI